MAMPLSSESLNKMHQAAQREHLRFSRSCLISSRLRVLSLGTCKGIKASLAQIFLMLNFSLPFYTLISSSTADHSLPFAFVCVCVCVCLSLSLSLTLSVVQKITRMTFLGFDGRRSVGRSVPVCRGHERMGSLIKLL